MPSKALQADIWHPEQAGIDHDCQWQLRLQIQAIRWAALDWEVLMGMRRDIFMRCDSLRQDGGLGAPAGPRLPKATWRTA